jgi:hypothetical protein
MKFYSMFLKISLAFVLLISAFTMSPASNNSPISFNNVAEAASCTNTSYNGYQKIPVSKKSLVGTAAVVAILSPYMGVKVAQSVAGGSSVLIGAKTAFTVRVYTKYCSSGGSQYMKQAVYTYNANNTKKLKGPYNRSVKIQTCAGCSK